MKSIGMARKVDQLGRVVLPAELRRLFGIREGDLVEIFVEGDRIVLSKIEERCVFCGTALDLREFAGKLVCRGCTSQLTAD
ncbi:MAG: AbrB/MazE/SpoVT family DNA-binding domain-containing protein [Acidimicrobiia bacterium]|nr:AbrB/MazE/SpoVT family DNA-binding domain-containing protein [Acidimicrobiia bacterium]